MTTKMMLEKENAALRRRVAGLKKQLARPNTRRSAQTKRFADGQVLFRQSEERFHSLFETSPDSTFIVDQITGGILFANSAASRLYGYSAAEFLRLNLRDLSAEPEKSVTAVRAGVTFVPHRRHRKKDGTVFAVEITGSYFIQDEQHLHTAFIRDITERQQIEERLREREERYRLLSELASDYVYSGWLYPDGHAETEWIAGAFEHITGYSIEAIKALPNGFATLVFPDDLELVITQQPQLDANQAVVQEYRILAKNGEPRWLRDSIQVIDDDAGRPAKHFLGTVQDITERKRAEEALSQNQARLRALIENTDARIWAVDSQYRLIASNTNFNAYLELVLSHGVTLGESVLADAYPLDVRNRWRNYYDRALQGESFNIESEAYLKEEPPRYVIYNFHPIQTLDGRIVGVTIFARDITERKRVEQTLREQEHFISTVVNTSPSIIYVYDLETRRNVYSNNGITRLLGYTVEDIQAMGTGLFATLIHPDDLAEVEAFQSQILAAADYQILENEYRVQHRDGTWHDLHTYETPFLRNPAGSVQQKIGVAIDITEHRHAEQERENLLREVTRGREQLQVLSRQLIDAQENERRNLARELHDEIGQALTAVRINLQTVQRNPASAASELPLTMSIDTIEKTLQQVRQLSLDLHPALLDDLGLIPALRWYIDRQTQGAGITTHMIIGELGEDLRPEIQLACFRVAQEALTNVLRHAHASQVLIELSKHDAELDVIIRDDGDGFDLAAAHARALHGETLGLLGMQERVELVGGYLEIESALGYGTEVHAHLPLVRANGTRERGSEPR